MENVRDSEAARAGEMYVFVSARTVVIKFCVKGCVHLSIEIDKQWCFRDQYCIGQSSVLIWVVLMLRAVDTGLEQEG